MKLIPIKIPNLIEVDINEARISVSKGDITEVLKLENGVNITKNCDDIVIGKIESVRQSKLKAHSLYRRLLNTIKGLEQKFSEEISVVGTGYFIKLEKDQLELELGYSHRIYIDIPRSIEVKIKDGKITIYCHNKQVLGTFAAKLEALRYPNVYSGEGVIITRKKYIRKVRVKKKK